MIKVSVLLTSSKIAAYLILIIGTIYSFINKDSNVLIATFSAVSAILMLKTFTTSKNRNNDYTNYHRSNDEIG